MKPERVIEILSDANRDENYTSQDVNDANTEAEFIIYRRIPAKPKKLTYKPLIDSGWVWECPHCHLAVGINKKAEDYTQEDKYCPSCGQALKWEG